MPKEVEWRSLGKFATTDSKTEDCRVLSAWVHSLNFLATAIYSHWGKQLITFSRSGLQQSGQATEIIQHIDIKEDLEDKYNKDKFFNG